VISKLTEKELEAVKSDMEVISGNQKEQESYLRNQEK
jgi:hypothetical protein